MSTFPRATHSQGWTGIAEAPDQHLSPVTFLVFPLAEPIQSPDSDLSNSGLCCTCDSQQLSIHCFAQVSFIAQQRKTEGHGDI